MNDDYEDIFGVVFKEQRDKIPVIFRPSRKVVVVGLIAIFIFTVGMLAMIPIWYSTGQRGDSCTTSMFTIYDDRILAIEVFFGIVVVILAAWLSISRICEKQAYKKASRFANMAYEAQRYRREQKWQEWKMNNREY